MKPIDYYVSDYKEFGKQTERFVRKKNFKNLPKQLLELKEPLSTGNFPGTLIREADDPEPYEVYKLRLPNIDSNAGKSNGYRIIYIVVTERKIVVFLTIYYKKEQETVSDTYIDGLIDGFFLESVPYDEDAEEGS